MLPAVTVVVPCYNQGHFLRQAVTSVQAQTFKDWEMIIVDDGSTDDTRRIAGEFGDPRIRYLYQANRGLSAARNAGIRYSTAPIIALLDSDDLWEPLFLESMLERLNRNPEAAAAYCGYSYVDMNGNRVGDPSIKVVPAREFRKTLFEGGNWLVPSAVVLRKLRLEQVGLFDESLGAVADSDLWFRLSERNDIVGVEEVLTGYRLHEASMSRDPDRMVSDFRRMVAKFCGPPDGDALLWDQSKKDLYARFYRYAARAYGAAGNLKLCAHHFIRLYKLSTSMALSMGIWRTFSRMHLPPQNRGQRLSKEDFTTAENNLLVLLNEVAKLAADERIFNKDIRRMKSCSYLALAEESVHSHFWRQAISWLCRSAFSCPRVMLFRAYWGTTLRCTKVLALPGSVKSHCDSKY